MSSTLTSNITQYYQIPNYMNKALIFPWNQPRFSINKGLHIRNLISINRPKHHTKWRINKRANKDADSGNKENGCGMDNSQLGKFCLQDHHGRKKKE